MSACSFILVLALVVQSGLPAFGQPATADLTPEELVKQVLVTVKEREQERQRQAPDEAALQALDEKISSLVGALAERGETAIPAIAGGLTSGDDLQATQLVRALSRIGGDTATALLVEVATELSFQKAAHEASWALKERKEAAVEAIRAALPEMDDAQRGRLPWVLGGIGGDASTYLLVELCGQTSSFPNAARAAVGRLENRPIRRPLSEDELSALVTGVESSSVMSAGSYARVLGKCYAVPEEVRLRPIIERLRRELASPSRLPARFLGCYTSPRVYVRNQFLLAISYVGEAAIPLLTEERRLAAGDAEAEKWWVLALGMAGDESVASELEKMVTGEPDRYVRHMAVKAYARSAKQDAVPLLKTLLSDTTESEYEDSCVRIPGRKFFLIRSAARSALSWLTRQGYLPQEPARQ